MQFSAVKKDGRVSFNGGPTNRGFTWSESLSHKGRKLMKLLYTRRRRVLRYIFDSRLPDARVLERNSCRATKRIPVFFLPPNKSIRETLRIYLREIPHARRRERYTPDKIAAAPRFLFHQCGRILNGVYNILRKAKWYFFKQKLIIDLHPLYGS